MNQQTANCRGDACGFFEFAMSEALSQNGGAMEVRALVTASRKICQDSLGIKREQGDESVECGSNPIELKQTSPEVGVTNA